MHSNYCDFCKSKEIFIYKLIDPSDPNCEETEDVCLSCKNKKHHI